MYHLFIYINLNFKKSLLVSKTFLSLYLLNLPIMMSGEGGWRAVMLPGGFLISVVAVLHLSSPCDLNTLHC